MIDSEVSSSISRLRNHRPNSQTSCQSGKYIVEVRRVTYQILYMLLKVM